MDRNDLMKLTLGECTPDQVKMQAACAKRQLSKLSKGESRIIALMQIEKLKLEI